MYNGTGYTSHCQAAKALGITRAIVRRHLASPAHPVYYVEEEAFGEIPVFAQKGNGFSVLFDSLKDCVAANYASSIQTVRLRMNSKKEGWRYAHFYRGADKIISLCALLTQ